jgi:hypothetical protein
MLKNVFGDHNLKLFRVKIMLLFRENYIATAMPKGKDM